MSKEKKYLKWYNKVGYGSGDVAGNVVYALLTSFVMIYLTDTIGMNAGIVWNGDTRCCQRNRRSKETEETDQIF